MKSAFLVSKGLLCSYDKQNNTWLLADVEFFFSCSTRHLTRFLCSLMSYQIKHSKRNSISTCAHVLFSISILRDEKIQSISQTMGSFRSAEKRRLENCLAFEFELSLT